MAKKGKSLGAWAFLIGVLLAIILGLFNTQLGNVAWISVVLVVLGLLVGLLNLGSGEAKDFLLAALALVIVSNLGGEALNILAPIKNVLDALLTLVVP
ncbi:MAG: hypothetical protein AABX65_02005, partial [Nanoarchaeota archaeon]